MAVIGLNARSRFLLAELLKARPGPGARSLNPVRLSLRVAWATHDPQSLKDFDLAVIVVASAVAGSLYSITQALPDVSWLQPAATGAIIGAVVLILHHRLRAVWRAPFFERGGADCR